MKKSLKIKTTVTMALVACFSLVFGLTMLASPATTAKADAPATFEMLGASVRYETAENANDNGIRFGVQLDKTAYAALTADGNAEAGILICPEDQYTGDLAVGTAKATKGVVKGEQGLENVMIGTWTENAGGYMQTWVYMTGIPEESFNRPISGRAYIDWNGDASDVSYSDTVTKAIADVALAVREDYEDENVYETTAEQYASLDDYLLNYDVKFIDAYGNEATQSVKYGDNLEVADDPATRTGYTFTGWYEKNGESAYAATATDFSAENATTVKYAKTFKSQFNTTGNVFEKPAILKTLGGRGQGVNSVDADDFEWHAKGDYIFADTGVSKAEGFTITATFVPETGAEYSFTITDDLENGRGRITYRMNDNKFYFYNYTDGEYNGETWAWYDSKERTSNDASALVAGTPATMSFVYSTDVFIVYVNGVRACSFIDTDGLQSGSSRKIKDLVGNGDTVYLGFGAYNGPTEGTVITDWGFSTGVSDSVANMLADLRAEGFTNNSDPNDNNPQFEVQATFKKGAAGRLGFMFRQAEWGRFTVFAYNTATGKFGYYKFGLTSQMREFTISNSTFDPDNDNTIKVVYKGDRILDVYINGTKMIFTDGRNNEFYLGWAYTGSSDSDKPFAWWGDISISTRKAMRVGLFHADAYDFGFTVTKAAQQDDTGEISISSKEDWSKLNEHKEGTFVLTSDIDFGGEAITRIGDGFNGTIDGQGHKISNFTINSTNQSLFGTVGSAAVMKNIAFTNVTMVGGVDTALISTKDFKGTLQDIYVQYDSITGLDTSGSKRMGLVFGRNGAPYDGYVVPKNVIIDVTACASTLEANINDLNSTNGNAWKVLSGFGRWEGTNVDLDSCFLVGADYITICAGSVYTNSYTDYEALKNENKTYTGWNTTSMWTIVDGVPKANAVA